MRCGRIAGVFVVACSATRPPAASLRNTASTTTSRVPSELCDTLKRVIENAPTHFAALRGKRLPFPSDMDPTDSSDGRWTSTISVAGSTATILKYSWTRWTLELHKPGFTYHELEQVVFACPAVAGWRHDDVSEVPAVTMGHTTVFVDDAHSPGDALTIDVHQDR